MNDLIANIHLWLNGYHTPWLDSFMAAYSYSANWLPVVLCLVMLELPFVVEGKKGKRHCLSIGLAPALAQLIVTLIVQPIKFIINEARPITFFAEHYPDIQLPLAEGVRMNTWLSFPSGHTATFFALAVSIILYLNHYIHEDEAWSSRKKNVIRWSSATVLILMAAIGGYSRIYLSQHFLHDVIAGAVIGIFSAWLAQRIGAHFREK